MRRLTIVIHDERANASKALVHHAQRRRRRIGKLNVNQKPAPLQPAVDADRLP